MALKWHGGVGGTIFILALFMCSWLDSRPDDYRYKSPAEVKQEIRKIAAQQGLEVEGVIGKVVHYVNPSSKFVGLEKQVLFGEDVKLGDEILVKGPETHFRQTIEKLEVNGVEVPEVNAGYYVWDIGFEEEVNKDDIIYKSEFTDFSYEPETEESVREKTYECITCGAKISKQEYEENEGQCDNCVAEDTIYAGDFQELGFE